MFTLSSFLQTFLHRRYHSRHLELTLALCSKHTTINSWRLELVSIHQNCQIVWTCISLFLAEIGSWCSISWAI